MGFKLHFEYSEETVQILHAEKGTVTALGNFTDNIGVHDETFDLMWNYTEDVTENGTIALIHLKPLTAEPFEIAISYSAPYTFNEAWEDVAFICNPILAEADVDTEEEGLSDALEITNMQTESVITGVLMQMDADTLDNLDETTEAAICAEVNRKISSLYRTENEYYSDFNEMAEDYKTRLTEKLKEDAEELDTSKSASALIEAYLAESGEQEVTADNVANLNAVFMQEGLDAIYEKYLSAEELRDSYIAIYGGEQNSGAGDSSHLKKSSHTVLICIAAAGSTGLCGGFILYLYRRMKNREKQK